MTTEIETLVAEVKQATDYQINKRILKEKIKTDLHLVYKNGMFLVTPELLAFTATWPDDTFYLADVYENPVEIFKEEFLQLARMHYHTVMNTWHQQHEELKRIRKV